MAGSEVPDGGEAQASLRLDDELMRGIPVQRDDVDVPDVPSAVARLLDLNRSITDQDLLLQGSIEHLGSGARSAEELLPLLHGVWPGAGITAVRLEAALSSGAKLGLLSKTVDLSGTVIWALAPEGSADRRASTAWRIEMFSSTAEQVRERAISAFGTDPGVEQCKRWVYLLRQAITAAVRQSGAAYDGQVHAVAEAALLPKVVDRDAMLYELLAGQSKPEIVQFLEECALAAFDPADIFCTELVTNVVTACVLHAVVGRRDQASAGGTLGALSGQRVVIDTPVALLLLGSERTAKSVQATLRAAVETGMDVILPEHVCEELRIVLDKAVRSGDVRRGAELSDEERALYGSLVDSEPVALFVQGVEDKRYRTWDDMERAAQRLPEVLGTVGITHRQHGNHDREVVRRCRVALKEELEDHHGRAKRGPINLDFDAETMAMVWRPRRRLASGTNWPGGWVLTPDSHLTPAMRRLGECAQWPFTLTIGQLGALVARCGAVPSLEELTKATVTLVAQEAGEALASRYPPNVAAELARALADGTGNNDGMRVAQTLSLAEILTDADAADPAVVTARVSARRMQRMDAAYEAQTKHRARDLALARERAQAKGDEAQVATGEVHQLASELSGAKQQTSELSERVAALEKENQDLRARGRRRDVAIVVGALQLMGAAVCLTLGRWPLAVVLFLATLIVSSKFPRWIRNGEEKVFIFLVICVPDLVTVCTPLYSYLLPTRH